jgi:hypothetical protein
MNGQTTGNISGITVDAITRAPLDNVKVRLGFAGLSTTSDAEGRFRFTEVAPMAHLVVAERSGYAKLDGGLGVRVELTPGGSVNGLVLVLSPEAVIAGRVLDAKGDLIRGASVEVTDADTRVTAALESSPTGSFRIGGLRAGRYLVGAQAWGQVERPRPLTYYPGELDRTRASVIELRAGESRGELDIAVREVQYATIRGQFTEPKSVTPGCIVAYEHRNRDPLGSTATAKLDPEGRFAMRMPRGDFRLKVLCLGQRPGARVLGFKDLYVGDQDVDNVVIPPSPIHIVRAKLRWSAGGRADAPTGTFTLSPTQGLGVLRFSAPKDDGWVAASEVTPDVYLIRVGQLPPGSYAQSIQTPSGEILRDGLDLLNGTSTDLEIVVSPDGGTISGQVLDAKRMPVLGAQVAISRATSRPAERELWSRFAAVDGEGRFAQSGMAPGDYEVTARVGGRVSSPQRVSIGPSARLEVQVLLPD